MTTPMLPDLLVINNLEQISYDPESKSLLLKTLQKEKHSEYILQIEIGSSALQEIISALKDFAAKTGKSIEDLAKPHNFH